MLDFELSLKGINVEDLNSSRQISRAYAAVEWLKTDPKSRWRAELLGSDTNIGWATDTYLLAGILNNLNAQAKGKKLRKDEYVTLPEQHIKKVKQVQRPRSVREMKLGEFFKNI